MHLIAVYAVAAAAVATSAVAAVECLRSEMNAHLPTRYTQTPTDVCRMVSKLTVGVRS